MTYEELREIGVLLNGGNVAGWKNTLATLIDKGPSTIRRWSNDPLSIPPSSEKHLRSLAHDAHQQMHRIGQYAIDETGKNKSLDLPEIDIQKLDDSQREYLKQWCFNRLNDLMK